MAGVTQAQLITNGSFESNPIGTVANSGGGTLVDSTTFTDWRIFSVGAPPIAGYQGSIVDASSFGAGGTPGDHAFRFDAINTGSPSGADYGLDRNSSKVAVSFGTNYTFSYDAALYGLTGGTFSFNVTLSEFNSSDMFLGNQTGFAPTLGATFQNYAFSWTPINPLTTQINIAFRPVTQEGFSSAVGLNNVALVPEPGTVALLGIAGITALFFRKRSRVA